jgi:hypothetical protein
MITSSIVLKSRLTEDSPDNFFEVTSSEDHLEDVESVEENFEERLVESDFTLNVPFVSFTNRNSLSSITDGCVSDGDPLFVFTLKGGVAIGPSTSEEKVEDNSTDNEDGDHQQVE